MWKIRRARCLDFSPALYNFRVECSAHGLQDMAIKAVVESVLLRACLVGTGRLAMFKLDA